jgi:hypothetical protein
MSDRETNVSIWEGALTSTCSAAATTITVDATAGVPAVPFFVVANPSSDDREVILIDDSTTGTSLVMSSAASRGQDGTTDVEHAIGTVVGIYPVPSHWTDINDRVDAAETTLATKLTEADIDTLAELNAIVGDATLDTSSATRVPTDLSVTNAKVAAAAAIAQSKIDGLVADLAAKLALAGGTLTGALVLDAAPTTDLQAATKKYVDDKGGSGGTSDHDAEQNLRLWELEASLLGTAEGFAGWQGDGFLTGQDEVSADGGLAVSRAVRLSDGSVGVLAGGLDTWTSRTTPGTDNMFGVAWSGTVFVAVGTGGAVWTSPAGTADTGTLVLNTVTLPATATDVYLLTEETLDATVTATYEATLDGGTTWETVTSGTTVTLGHSGTSFALRVTLERPTDSTAEGRVFWLIGYAS